MILRFLKWYIHDTKFVNTNYYSSGLTADEATLERLVYYPWITGVDDEDKVDHPSHKYLANAKYSDKFWAKVAPQHSLSLDVQQLRPQGENYVPPELEEATRNFV